MTDRDLFYCTDFSCDGHARSNETCVDPETLLPIPGCKPKPPPTYTVSGNSMRVFRLDPEGNPVGEPVEFPGPVSFDIPEGTVSDATVLMDSEGFSSLTLDVEMGQVDQSLLALLTGTEPMPYEVWAPIHLTWWQRAWNRITRRNKGWRLVP